jgi:hypothetical protein
VLGIRGEPMNCSIVRAAFSSCAAFGYQECGYLCWFDDLCGLTWVRSSWETAKGCPPSLAPACQTRTP